VTAFAHLGDQQDHSKKGSVRYSLRSLSMVRKDASLVRQKDRDLDLLLGAISEFDPQPSDKSAISTGQAGHNSRTDTDSLTSQISGKKGVQSARVFGVRGVECLENNSCGGLQKRLTEYLC